MKNVARKIKPESGHNPGQPGISVTRSTESSQQVLELRYQQLFETVQEGILILDSTTGEITDVNPYLINLLGYTREEMIARKFWQIDAFKELAASESAFQDLQTKEPIFFQAIALVSKDGGKIQVEFAANIQALDTNKIMQCNIRDAVNHKRIHERTAALAQADLLLQTMMDHIPDHIFFKDINSRFIRNSRSQAAMLGLNDPDLSVGKTDFDFFPHAQRAFDQEQEIIRSGKPLVDFEERVVWPDEHETWVSTTKMPLIDEDGHIIGTFGVARDITARKRAEEMLRKAKDELEAKVAERTAELSAANKRLQVELEERKLAEETVRERERQLNALFEIIPVGICILDADNKIILLNPTLEKLLGASEEQLRNGIGQKWKWLNYAGEPMPRGESAAAQAFKEHGAVYNVETGIIKEDDSVIWVDMSAVKVDFPDWKMVLVMSDLSERKRSEEALRLNERRFQALIEYSADAIAVTDVQGKVLYLSPSSEKIDGYAPDELLDRDAAEQTHPDDLERRKQAYAEVLANPGKPVYVQWRRRHKDGAWRWLEGVGINLLDVPGINGIVTNYRDITERKQADEKLRESEERFRLLFENMHETLVIQEIVADESGQPIDLRYLDINPAVQRLMGRPRSEIIGQTRGQISEEPDSEGVEVASLVSSTGKPFHMTRYSPGFGRWFESFTYLVGPGKIATFALDITERKQAEDALYQSEERFSKAFQANPAAVVITRISDGYVIDVNQSFQKILGYDRAELLGITGLNLNIFDDPAEQETMLEKLRQDRSVRDHETKLRTKSGEIRYVLFSMEIIELGGQTCILSIFFDVTERKNAEAEIHKLNAELEQRVMERTEQLANANKELEAFSYSVSHDLRAPLRGIDGWSLALLEDYGSKLDEEGQAYIARVRSETQRMGQLIDDMLELSRITRADMHNERVNLSAIARMVASRLQETEPQRDVEFAIQKELKARGDSPLLEVVLTNLLSNAFKFTSKIPKAHIEFGETIIEKQHVYFVRDNGAGFNMSFAKKLFGAFQRMHTVAEFPGTGIGLATVQRIIHRHGGRIWAQAQVNQGATFYFTLEEPL
jgi:PAS domain S-box-containing protein